MQAIKARVLGGKIVVETPVSFPEGTELLLQVVDEDEDDIDAAESAALDASLARGWKELTAGELGPAKEVIERLRRLE